MAIRAREGTCLATLVKTALPVFQEAERQSRRAGPGRKPQIPEWLIAVFIMIAVGLVELPGRPVRMRG